MNKNPSIARKEKIPCVRYLLPIPCKKKSPLPQKHVQFFYYTNTIRNIADFLNSSNCPIKYKFSSPCFRKIGSCASKDSLNLRKADPVVLGCSRPPVRIPPLSLEEKVLSGKGYILFPGMEIGNIKRFRREWDDLLSPTVKKKASIRIDVCSGVKVPSVPVSTALHWAFFSPSVTSQPHAELLGTVIVVAPSPSSFFPLLEQYTLESDPPQLLSVVAKTLDLSKQPRGETASVVQVDC